MYSRDLIPQRDVAREGARKIPPHEIEVSEGVSAVHFHKEKKHQYISESKDGHWSDILQFLIC